MSLPDGAPAPRLSVVTIGVADVAASAAFYEALGFVRKVRATGDEIAFFEAGGTVLAVWDARKLAADAALPQEAPGRFRGTTLAWNLGSPAEVDAAYRQGIAAGARPLREPGPTDYGGHRGYFADPDDHVWEVVWAPGFELAADGRLLLPG